MATEPSSTPVTSLTRSATDPDTGKQRIEMKCPHCEEWQDILAFKPLQRKTKYEHALNSVVKCGRCSHTFSPRWTNEDS